MFKLSGKVENKSEFIIYLPQVKPENGNFIHIQEGSGDALTKNNIDDGYIDYIDYTRFSLAGPEEISYKDGGQCLISEMYIDLSEEDIIQTVLNFENLTDVVRDVVVIDFEK